MQYRFGEHLLDIDRRELRRGGAPVAVEPQVFDLIVYLIENRERVVSKDDLIGGVWGGRIVSDSTLSSRITAARKAIGDSGEAQALIRTMHRRGLRFIGEVQRETASASSMAAAAHTPAASEFPLPDKPSIAVLPFSNLSGDPQQEYFADGMVEDVITNLSRLRWLFVIARNSSFTYKGQAIDIRQVGRELGVRYVLEGSVRRAGSRMRVTAQLIEAENGRHVWAERYDRGVEDIFAVQDEITETISATLEPEIGAAERERARSKPPGNLGAWEVYQRGMWHLLRRNRQDYAAARGLFRDAVKLDPDFATPHAALAVSCFWLITHGFTSDPEHTRTELATHAALAVDLDARDSMAHSAMGLAYMEMAQHDRAIAEHEIATEINPNSSFGQWSFGYALMRADRYEEALLKFELALRLNPRDPAAWSYLTLKAATMYHLRRYEEAAAAAQEAARTQLADVVWPLVHRASSLGQLERRHEAALAIAELRARWPDLTVSMFRAWPHNQPRSARSLEHIVEGLRKAGLPEA